jgi:2-dehydro-3-deoxygluconokinase
MVELARDPDGRYTMRFGGDTFNTAVYLARSGIGVTYATLLGDDPYSGRILDLAREEGVGIDLIERKSGRNAGLYLIETADSGERTFHYWRDRSPARELFDGPEAERIAAAMRGARLVYFSGVTLSLYAPPARTRLADALVAARAAGALIAMDGNYRPRGWGGDATLARAEFERFWRLSDIALPSLEDGELLWGDRDPSSFALRLQGFDVHEIVVKAAEAPALCVSEQEQTLVPVPRAVAAIDTTAAGDSFNAAYLAARLGGRDPQAAVLAGHALAAIVVGHRGAVVPRAATDAVLGARA